MSFREKKLKSGVKVILGRDSKTNDELMKKFKGTYKTILHTVKPGSPFGIIDSEDPSRKDVRETATFVARHSKDWRDNQGDVAVSVFTGKDAFKEGSMKEGTWGVKKSRKVLVKKEDISRIR